jgi:toxin CcdB
MARFDVFEARGPGYLLDCQADTLSQFKTRFVVPLLPAEGAMVATRLHPVFEIENEGHIMVTQLASAVAVAELGRIVTSLSDEHSAIMNALDMLLTGY